jgi:hypothetical protein
MNKLKFIILFLTYNNRQRGIELGTHGATFLRVLFQSGYCRSNVCILIWYSLYFKKVNLCNAFMHSRLQKKDPEKNMS